MAIERRPAAKIDPRDQPAYGLVEAARYLRLPPATLRAWTFGRPYPTAKGESRFSPLIRPASKQPPLLSFSNLIEAHVLRALRTEHGVSVKAVREAARFAERKLQINRLLLSPELCTKAGDIFLDRYGQLINLSASGQLAMRQVLDAHLKRVEWEQKLPIRLYPFVLGEAVDADKPIAIDPRIAFGRPVVASRGVSTAAIVERLDAGEPVAEVAADYELTEADVAQAALYERAA
jgi:uncharacterized protein (DUF433 family)